MSFPFSSPQVTIASGQSLSPAFFVGAGDITAVQMPAAWDAASLTFQGSATETGTYEDLYDDSGTEIAVTAAASKMSSVGGGISTASLPWMKIRSGTGSVPVNQTANRILSVIIRKRVPGGLL